MVNMKAKWLKYIWQAVLAMIALFIFLLAVKALYRLTQTIHYTEVLQAIDNIPHSHLIIAFLVVAFGYILLTLYDFIALKQIQQKIHYGKVALTAFTAYAISHTIGASVITATGIRYRFYRISGLTSNEIANIVWLVSMAFTFGISSLVGISLTLSPEITVQLLNSINPEGAFSFLNNADYVRALGIAILLTIIGTVIYSGKTGKQLLVKGWRFDLPPAKILIQQIAISILDLSTVALVLYLLLPPSEHISYLATFSAFIQSISVSILSHVPGGLGIFEITMIAALPEVDKADLLGVLLVFRLMYYIIPFLLALFLFVGYETYIYLNKPKTLQQK